MTKHVVFESELVPAPAPPRPEPTRRVVIEVPESKALAMSRALNNGFVWWDTDVGPELAALHEALGEDWRTEEQAAAGEPLE